MPFSLACVESAVPVSSSILSSHSIFFFLSIASLLLSCPSISSVSFSSPSISLLPLLSISLYHIHLRVFFFFATFISKYFHKGPHLITPKHCIINCLITKLLCCSRGHYYVLLSNKSAPFRVLGCWMAMS